MNVIGSQCHSLYFIFCSFSALLCFCSSNNRSIGEAEHGRDRLGWKSLMDFTSMVA